MLITYQKTKVYLSTLETLIYVFGKRITHYFYVEIYDY